MRTKQDYVLNQKNGKFVPEKVGLKAISMDGTDYEFTIVFDLNIKHFAVCSKDRSGLFIDKSEFIINATTGNKILGWCSNVTNVDDARKQIENCNDIEQLRLLYKRYYSMKDLGKDFILQKESIQSKKQLLNPQNFSQNGINTNSPRG